MPFKLRMRILDKMYFDYFGSDVYVSKHNILYDI